MLFRSPQCPESNLALTRNAEGWDDFVGESVAWRETDVAKAEAVVGEIKGTGGQARAYAADLRQVAEIDRLVTSFVSDVGRIDILVNCAGVYFPTVSFRSLRWRSKALGGPS
jgi:NAD(P)-dependent dehydrogenase (short-subunit alcohol dehydrogenase family)